MKIPGVQVASCFTAGFSRSVLFCILTTIAPLSASEIIVFGDSWAEPLVEPLQAVLSENGHGDVRVHATEFRGLAARLGTGEGAEFITRELELHPDVDIVQLTIGFNDVHCLIVDGECTPNWVPSLAGTQAEADILDTIMVDVEMIVDHVQSVRPGVEIFWHSYDFLRPTAEMVRMGTPPENNAVHMKWDQRAQALADRKPGLTFHNSTGLMQVKLGFSGVPVTGYDPSYPIPAGDPSLPDPALPSPLEAFRNKTHLNARGQRIMAEEHYRAFYGPLLEGEGFRINPGLNDAWYDPATSGQGFFITVFPDIGQMFLAWFTYDLQRPSEGVTAQLGEPGHRWLTAQGPYADNQAVLDVWVFSGGVFDSAEPAVNSVKDGEVVVEFSSCNSGTVSYDLVSADRQGVIPIERIALDNVALCEALSEQASTE